MAALTQDDFFFGNVTVVASATAVSIFTLLGSASYTPKGGCVSLNVTFDADTYWGSSSSVTDADGALLPANTPLSDSATGGGSNMIPVAHMFCYKAAAGGDTDGVIYARFTP